MTAISALTSMRSLIASTSHETASDTLARVQGLSPTGIGARFAECLKLQLRDFDPHDTPVGVRPIIDNISFLNAQAHSTSCAHSLAFVEPGAGSA